MSRQSSRRLILHGLGRSGTTWLYKIMDHHDETLCLYEPESVLWSRKDTSDADRAALQREIATRVFDQKALRNVRKRPFVRKAFRDGATERLRWGYILAASGVANVLRLAGRSLGRRVLDSPVPHMAKRPPEALVAKLVRGTEGICRAVASDADCRFAFIIRHPCGYALSNLSGQKAGKMRTLFLPPRAHLAFYEADPDKRAAMTEDDFTQVEILAFRWAAYNALIAEAAAKNDRAVLIDYEDLCENPIAVSERVFALAGLSMTETCREFLRASMESDTDSDQYHGVVRNPQIAAGKWRSALGTDDIARIEAIVSRTEIGRRFFERAS